MTEDQNIQKGFNAGYILAKHKPDLADVLKKGLVGKDDGYSAGFLAGAKEYELEVERPRTRNYDTRNLAQASKSPEKGKSKDKDDREI